MANRVILEPVVEEASSLIHDAEFTNLVREIGFLRESGDEDKPENPSPPKVIFLACTKVVVFNLLRNHQLFCNGLEVPGISGHIYH